MPVLTSNFLNPNKYISNLTSDWEPHPHNCYYVLKGYSSDRRVRLINMPFLEISFTVDQKKLYDSIGEVCERQDLYRCARLEADFIIQWKELERLYLATPYLGPGLKDQYTVFSWPVAMGALETYSDGKTAAGIEFNLEQGYDGKRYFVPTVKYSGDENFGFTSLDVIESTGNITDGGEIKLKWYIPFFSPFKTDVFDYTDSQGGAYYNYYYKFYPIFDNAVNFNLKPIFTTIVGTGPTFGYNTDYIRSYNDWVHRYNSADPNYSVPTISVPFTTSFENDPSDSEVLEMFYMPSGWLTNRIDTEEKAKTWYASNFSWKWYYRNSPMNEYDRVLRLLYFNLPLANLEFMGVYYNPYINGNTVLNCTARQNTAYFENAENDYSPYLNCLNHFLWPLRFICAFTMQDSYIPNLTEPVWSIDFNMKFFLCLAERDNTCLANQFDDGWTPEFPDAEIRWEYHNRAWYDDDLTEDFIEFGSGFFQHTATEIIRYGALGVLGLLPGFGSTWV